jgi:hypothetical protein
MSQRAMRRLSGLAVVAAFALLGGCALDTDQRPEARTDDALGAEEATRQTSGEAGNSSPCTDGVVEQCVIRLPTHDGVQTCFHGLKLCEGGDWSACLGADEIEKRLEG